jgi:hypothetical protein
MSQGASTVKLTQHCWLLPGPLHDLSASVTCIMGAPSLSDSYALGLPPKWCQGRDDNVPSLRGMEWAGTSSPCGPLKSSLCPGISLLRYLCPSPPDPLQAQVLTAATSYCWDLGFNCSCVSENSPVIKPFA